MAASSVPQFKPWREIITIHPSAELFPLLSETDPDELQKMADSIKSVGLTAALEFLDEPGIGRRLLDGRNRLDALALAGFRFALDRKTGEMVTYDPDGREYELWIGYRTAVDEHSATELVIAFNIRRRHLNRDQVADLIEKVLKEDPERSNRSIAEMLHSSAPTVGKVRRAAEDAGVIPVVDVTVGKDGRARTSTPEHSVRRKAPGIPPSERIDPDAVEPPAPTVRVDKEELVQLKAGRKARDSGDLFNWATDGAQKIARVFVTDGIAQTSLAKMQQVHHAIGIEIQKRVDEARQGIGVNPNAKPARPQRGAKANGADDAVMKAVRVRLIRAIRHKPEATTKKTPEQEAARLTQIQRDEIIGFRRKNRANSEIAPRYQISPRAVQLVWEARERPAPKG